MDKLIFKIPRPAKKLNANDRPVMRVTPEAYNAVEEISARTGLSNTFIASRMIEFAAANTEVILEETE